MIGTIDMIKKLISKLIILDYLQYNKKMLANNWFTAKSIEDLLENNIQAIYGKSESPFMCLDINEPTLYDDTMPNFDIIIEINKKGFLTNNSQPSSYEELFTKLPDENDHCGYIEENYNRELHIFILDKEGNYNYKCLEYQKAYCSGFIHKFQFEKLQKTLKDNYNLYYYNYFTKEFQDGDENLTYYEYYNQIHYSTNFNDIKEFAKDELGFLVKYVNSEMLNKIKEEMIYIEIIDKDYNTGKNIYQDILHSLE